MEPWTKKSSLLRGTRYVTRLDPIEREMLGGSAATVAERLMERARTAPKDELAELTGMPSGHAEPPKDPALARLLPSFFAPGAEVVEGDESLTRQLTETDIIKHKLMHLRFVTDALGPNGSVNISLVEEEVRPWLGALADIRNYHAAQLEQLKDEIGEDADRVQAGQNYLDWLGFHLDSLLTAKMGELELLDLDGLDAGEAGESPEGTEGPQAGPKHPDNPER